MNFNIEQIQKMMEIFSKNQAVFIGSSLGIKYLSEYDKFILDLYGIKLDDIQYIPDVRNMFYFGMYSEFIGGNNSFKSKRKDFDEWFQKEIDKPLSIKKLTALEFVEKRAFNDITGLGNKISNKFNNSIITASLSDQAILQEKVKTASAKAIEKNQTQQQLSSILRELTDDWARDFSRISDYIMQEAYGQGRLAEIVDNYGEDTLVYKQTFPGVCKYCEKNYGTPGEEPVIYTIQELMANGDNIGRKEQLPVVGPAHPWARSILHPIPPNGVWDNETKQFIIKRNTQGVKRDSKVKITITK